MSSEYERAIAAFRERLEEAREAMWWRAMTGQTPAQPYIDAKYRVLPEDQRQLPQPKGEA